MKNLIILLLSLVSLQVVAQSEQYAFVDSSLWYHHSVFVTKPGSSLPPTSHHSYQNFIILNDTSSVDTNVQRVVSTDNNWSVTNSIHGYIKSADSKAWFKKPLENWRVIYNFSLAVGDTFSFNLEKNTPYVEKSIVELKVLKVDSILMNQRYRKRIYFENFSGSIRPVWVEGMGDYNYGLITDYGRIINTDRLGGDSEILCFSEGSTPVIGNCKSEDITSISDLNFSDRFEIYPNPFEDNVNFYIDLPLEFNRVQLINSMGSVIFNGNLEIFTQYSFENLPPEVYTIIVSGNKGTIVKRVTKTGSGMGDL